MPQFYFHLRAPAGLERDEIGVPLKGIEEAYLEACHTIPLLSAELVRKRAGPHRYAFEITDGADNLLMEVPFSEVLDRARRPARAPSVAPWQQAAAEMVRTARLITGLREERAALRATLAETKRILDQARQAVRAA